MLTILSSLYLQDLYLQQEHKSCFSQKVTVVNTAAPGLTLSTYMCPGDAALQTQETLRCAPPHQTVLTDEGSVCRHQDGCFPTHFVCHAVCLSGHLAAAIC